MSLPGDLTTITVTGSFPNIAGQPQAGSVTFDPGQPVADSGGLVILTGAVTRQVWNGKMQPVALPCTDNAGLNPTGFPYLVTEKIGLNTRSYPVFLPHTLGATVDLSQLSPAVGVPATIAGVDGGSAVSGGFPAGDLDGGGA